jgi:Xaa-Pro aminopeptidase
MVVGGGRGWGGEGGRGGRGTGNVTALTALTQEASCIILQTRPHPLPHPQVCSNEPGYYEDGGFGVRIENLVVVKEVETANRCGAALETHVFYAF